MQVHVSTQATTVELVSLKVASSSEEAVNQTVKIFETVGEIKRISRLQGDDLGFWRYVDVMLKVTKEPGT